MSMTSKRENGVLRCDAHLARERCGQHDDGAEALYRALLCQEAELSEGLPAFASIAARIDKNPSHLEASSWTAGKSLRVSGILALSQLRIVPQAVLATALVMAAVVACAAYLASVMPKAIDPTWLFSTLLLVGAAATVSIALSSERADSIALVTPIGPQTITLIRLVAVLCIDGAAGVGSCGIAALLGLPPDPASLVSSWLAPLVAVSGVSAFTSVWTGSAWAGSIVGMAIIPLVVPAAQAISDWGFMPVAAAVQGTVGPAGIALLGIALLVATICVARRTMLSRMEAA